MSTAGRTIDCHAHVGRFEGYDLSEGTLLSELRGAGIDLALVSNIDGATVPGKTLGLEPGPTDAAVLALVRRHPSMIRGLAWGRPDHPMEADEVRTHLRRLAGERLAPAEAVPWTSRAFVGLKLHPEMNQYTADAPEVDPWLEGACLNGWPVVVHCDGSVDEASASRIHALARRHPRVPFVLYHTGFGGPHEPAMEAAVAARDTGDARLYLETSQLPAAVALAAVERVGPGRVLFGTDATYYGAGHYREYDDQRRALEGLGLEAARAILHDNAAALFGLAPDGPPLPTSTSLP